MAADAAEAADEAPRASMMAAPRLATVGMNVSRYQASSSTFLAALWPSTSAWRRSGNCVAEWLPHTVIFLMDSTGTASLLASCEIARLWSRRIIAVKRSAGTSGALACAMRAFVLAGLPTTRTLMSSAAPALIASPWGLKMPPLASRRSPRSMPGPRGRAPTSRPMLVPLKASLASLVISMLLSSGNAASLSSIAVPSAAFSAGSISSRLRETGTSGPSSAPDAMRKRRA
jgi:hypothetical protein